MKLVHDPPYRAPKTRAFSHLVVAQHHALESRKRREERPEERLSQGVHGSVSFRHLTNIPIGHVDFLSFAFTACTSRTSNKAYTACYSQKRGIVTACMPRTHKKGKKRCLSCLLRKKVIKYCRSLYRNVEKSPRGPPTLFSQYRRLRKTRKGAVACRRANGTDSFEFHCREAIFSKQNRYQQHSSGIYLIGYSDIQPIFANSPQGSPRDGPPDLRPRCRLTGALIQSRARAPDDQKRPPRSKTSLGVRVKKHSVVDDVSCSCIWLPFRSVRCNLPPQQSKNKFREAFLRQRRSSTKRARSVAGSCEEPVRCHPIHCHPLNDRGFRFHRPLKRKIARCCCPCCAPNSAVYVALTLTVALAVLGPLWKSSPPLDLSLSQIWTR